MVSSSGYLVFEYLVQITQKHHPMHLFTFFRSLLATLLIFSHFAGFSATRTLHTDSTIFNSLFAPTEMIIDDYMSSKGYPVGFTVLSNADMTAVLGETEYFTTGFPDWNVVQEGIYYCAGCNGSYRLSFANTSVSTGGIGVEGVGVNILTNDLPYLAYVIYGDGTTENIPIPIGASYFGLTSPDLITSIHFGLADGLSSQLGSFVINLLTIAGSPAPAIPTMGQWGFITLLLLLLIASVVALSGKQKVYEIISK